MREAVAKGYAEPDPRDDLSGRDVLRKGLILARLLGYAGPAPAPRTSCRRRSGGSPSRGSSPRLASLDEGWRRRVAGEAAPRARPALRGRGHARAASPRDCGPSRASSRLGALTGTRNLLSFTTRRYRAEPLVVSGPGAGAEVTAAGILNDIQSLASE